MLHLSLLLLILQYCSLFIFYHFYHYHLYSSFHSFRSFVFFIIIIIIHFILLHFSSPSRSSVVNVVLIFNDSLIIPAPESPILLPVNIFHFYHNHFILHFIFIIIIIIHFILLHSFFITNQIQCFCWNCICFQQFTH